MYYSLIYPYINCCMILQASTLKKFNLIKYLTTSSTLYHMNKPCKLLGIVLSLILFYVKEYLASIVFLFFLIFTFFFLYLWFCPLSFILFPIPHYLLYIKLCCYCNSKTLFTYLLFFIYCCMFLFAFGLILKKKKTAIMHYD